MYGKIITAGGLLGTVVLAFALAGVAGEARSHDDRCNGSWPHYAPSCLKTTEGEALGKPVRFIPTTVDPRFDDLNYFPE